MNNFNNVTLSLLFLSCLFGQMEAHDPRLPHLPASNDEASCDTLEATGNPGTSGEAQSVEQQKETTSLPPDIMKWLCEQLGLPASMQSLPPELMKKVFTYGPEIIEQLEDSLSGRIIPQNAHREELLLRDIVICPQEKIVVAQCTQGYCHLLKIDGTYLCELVDEQGNLVQGAAELLNSPSGQTISVRTYDHCYLFDKNGSLIRKLEAIFPSAGCKKNRNCMWSFDEKIIAVYQQTLWRKTAWVLYDQNGRLLRPGRSLWYNEIAFSPYSRRLAFTSDCEYWTDHQYTVGIFQYTPLGDNFFRYKCITNPCLGSSRNDIVIKLAFTSDDTSCLALDNHKRCHVVDTINITNDKLVDEEGNALEITNIFTSPDGKITVLNRNLKFYLFNPETKTAHPLNTPANLYPLNIITNNGKLLFERKTIHANGDLFLNYLSYDICSEETSSLAQVQVASSCNAGRSFERISPNEKYLILNKWVDNRECIGIYRIPFKAEFAPFMRKLSDGCSFDLFLFLRLLGALRTEWHRQYPDAQVCLTLSKIVGAIMDAYVTKESCTTNEGQSKTYRKVKEVYAWVKAALGWCREIKLDGGATLYDAIHASFSLEEREPPVLGPNNEERNPATRVFHTLLIRLGLDVQSVASCHLKKMDLVAQEEIQRRLARMHQDSGTDDDDSDQMFEIAFPQTNLFG